MKIAVLGGGSFGTVVANLVAENGHSVSLWARSEDTATLMQKERVNQRYHPKHRLHDHICVTSDLKQVLEMAELLFFAVPSNAYKELAKLVSSVIKPEVAIVSTA